MGLSIRHNPPGGNSRRVFLAIPSYGALSGVTAFSLFRSHPALIEAGFDVELGLLLGDCHVDDARNRLVEDFLESRCDDLVFIDNDVGFQTQDLIRLIKHDVDVVGGAYPKKSDIAEYPVWLPGGEIWTDKNGLIEINGIGTGFLRISRNALQKLAETSQRYKIQGDDERNVAMIFERIIVEGARLSGDMAFCHKWRQMGGKVYVDPACYLEHHGDKVWSGTYGAYLRKTNGLALTNGINRIRDGKETDADYLDLMLEWDNDPYSASCAFLKACVMVARQVKGHCLETGSGLSTLVLAAANPALTVHCLENDPVWAAKLDQAIRRVGLTNIVLHKTPLIQYPAGRWYQVPEVPWDRIELVISDGPPRQEGNRQILFGVMATRGCKPKCVLVDDANTEGETLPSTYTTEIKGELRKFAVGLRK